MSSTEDRGPDVVEDQAEAVNEVRLVGRLAADPRLRELPSGDTVWNLRVVVERGRCRRARRSRVSGSTRSSARSGRGG